MYLVLLDRKLEYLKFQVAIDNYFKRVFSVGDALDYKFVYLGLTTTDIMIFC